MAVRFVIGRTGTGKTWRCFHEIVEMLRERPLGPGIYWLLPKQATFSAERELTCAAGLAGYCRARVLSFDQLGQDLMDECGGGAAAEITGLGRQMILGHLLRQNAIKLKFFHRAAHHAGLAGKIDKTIAEFERCGKDPSQLDALLAELSAGQRPEDLEEDTLLAKLHDLQLIYRQYTDYLGQERLDPARRMAHMLECIECSPALRGATVFIDGFSEFDEFQRRIIARLGQVCQRVEVTLLMDPASEVLRSGAKPRELGLFHHNEETCRRLLNTLKAEGTAVEGPLYLEEVRRFRTSGLRKIEGELFGLDPDGHKGVGTGTVADEIGELTLVEAPNQRAEVDAAARHILHLLSRGLRLREIAVVVRQLEDYHDLINASFGEHNIRYFVDRRRSMGHHPLLQFLRAVLSIAQQDWPHESVMILMKTALAGLSLAEADELENYVLAHRIRAGAWGSAEPWQYRRDLTRASEEDGPSPAEVESSRMDALRRRLSDRIRPFAERFESTPGQTWPVREIATAIFELLERFGVRRTLSGWIASARDAGRLEEAGEHEQVWNEMAGLFDQLVELLGDEPVSLENFDEVLESALESFDLALTPPTVDEVLVGQVDRTRTPAVRAVLVLGLNEGSFPYAAKESSLLSDMDRGELRRRDFDIHPETERLLLDEELLGYVAFTRASESLWVSRPTSNAKGKAVGESAFWRRLRTMFPEIGVESIPQDERTQAGLIATPRQLLTSLMRWVRAEGAVVGEEPWPALYQWLADHPADDGPLDNLRYRVWKALRYGNEASLSPEVAARLFPDPLTATAGQLETFATCQFKHFIGHGLHLSARDEDDDPTFVELDRIYHQILERLVTQLLRRKKDFSSLSQEEAQRLVRNYAEQIGQSLRGS